MSTPREWAQQFVAEGRPVPAPWVAEILATPDIPAALAQATDAQLRAEIHRRAMANTMAMFTEMRAATERRDG